MNEAFAFRAVIFAKRLPTSNEGDVQSRIEERLIAAGIAHKREVRLPGKAGRIDFALTLDGLRYGVEIKVKSGGGNTSRQLLRYALSEQFDRLILITTKPFSAAPSFTCGQREIPVSVWQTPI